jgi:hypothetical protein
LNATSRAKSKRQVEANGPKRDMKLLLHLEAENGQLRDQAVTLMLENQSLRDGLQLSQSERPDRPNRSTAYDRREGRHKLQLVKR